MVKIFLTELIVLITTVVLAAQPSLSIPVTISDDATPPNVQILYFGLDPAATDGIDILFDESDLPPAPPIGNFDARFVLPAGGFNGSLNSWKDYRGASLPFTGIKEHRLKYQRGSNQGGNVIKISYSLPPTITVLIQDIIIGTIINTTLSGSGIFTVSNPDVFGSLKFFVNYLPPKTLNLTALIEGFFDGTNMVSDTVTVELHNAASPYALVDQAKVVLNTSGVGTGNFYSAAEATNYYITVKHRNALETWSGSTPQFSSGTMSYDFTSAQSQAYGSNMMQKGTKWCIFSGDVNQDGNVDLSDLIEVDNDNANFVTGYVPSDVNGDNSSDLSDMIIVDNNNAAFVGKVTP